MSYVALRNETRGLTTGELAARVFDLDRAAGERGFECLSVEERHLLIQGITHLPASSLDDLIHCSTAAKTRLRFLREAGLNTHGRTGLALVEDLLDTQALHRLDRTPLVAGPAVVLVANTGAQVPVSGPTLGNRLRKQRGLQPPIGAYFTASLLALFGVEAHVFNLALGETELKELEETFKTLHDRLGFVSFSSSFLGKAEFDSLYRLHSMLDVLRADGISPRFVGGGMGVFFSRDIYLRYAPLEVIIGRYGGVSFVDMIFSSDYCGPRDNRASITLFGHIPNLHIAVNTAQGVRVHSSKVESYSEGERRVLANRFDIRMVPLPSKYWSSGAAMGICSPDDLNVPVEFGISESATRTTAYDPIDAPNGELHPSNYIYKPKSIKIMTTYGNCPRGCKFCQFTRYDRSISFLSAPEAVSQFNQAVAVYPDLHMFVLDDDDFLLRRDHCLDLIACLRENEPTKGRVFYIETAPVEVEPNIIRQLRGVGFRAILLGIESPVERIVRHTGKLWPHHSFERFLQTPQIAFDAGMFTRISSILFYPIVTEAELVQTLKGLTDFISYGISVSVFPFVKALPGTEFSRAKEHDFKTTRYEIPDGSGRVLELNEYVLPDDPVVRELSRPSLQGTALQLGNLLQRHGIIDDYPMSLGVLAFFLSVVRAWVNVAQRSTSDDILDCLWDGINGTVSKLIRKHFVQHDVLQTVRDLMKGDQKGYKRVQPWIKGDSLPFVLDGLRMLLDFGTVQEVVGGARLMELLAQDGIKDVRLFDSLLYCLGRSLPSALHAEVQRIVNQLEAHSAVRPEGQ